MGIETAGKRNARPCLSASSRRFARAVADSAASLIGPVQESPGTALAGCSRSPPLSAAAGPICA